MRYAIADVAALVAPGGAIDGEARDRGVTIYMPDRRAPLHPAALGEGAGSLLPGAERPRCCGRSTSTRTASPCTSHLERATVRSRRALSYAEAQEAIDGGHRRRPRCGSCARWACCAWRARPRGAA